MTATSPGQPTASPARPRLLRPKGNIPRVTLLWLAVAACVPLGISLLRVLGQPWTDLLAPGLLEPLRALGAWCNRELTLQWIPHEDRGAVLYLLLLPTGALLITLARLTLGLRVLGLRAILLAIGFQAVGILPSLALMAVVIAMILVVRPWMRSARLPLYARLPVILSLCALVMVAALMAAPWLGSVTLWNVAFFPVVIMAMMAEGVARTLEQDDAVMATWRALWTISLALLIAAVDMAASTFTFHFPEVLITQLVAVVFVAEFLDLRLLEPWPARISRYLAGQRTWYTPRPKVAVIRNRQLGGVLHKGGPQTPQTILERKVQRQVDALRASGFTVKVLEGDRHLMGELDKFLCDEVTGDHPGGMVLNLAAGLQGNGRTAHVPAMLELCGLPYTGPDPIGMARLCDRYALWSLLGREGIPVPRHFLVTNTDPLPEVDFPALVFQRTDPHTSPARVRDPRQLAEAVHAVVRQPGATAVIEQQLPGPGCSVCLLGHDEDVQALPIVARSEASGNWRPLPGLREEEATTIRDLAVAAFRVSGLRDFGRIDLRRNEFDEPVVTAVRWDDLLSPRGAFLTAAAAHGMDLPELLTRILGSTARRYMRVRPPKTRHRQPSAPAPNAPQERVLHRA